MPAKPNPLPLTVYAVTPGHLTVYRSLPDRVTVNVYGSFDRCTEVVDLTPEAARKLARALLAHADAL